MRRGVQDSPVPSPRLLLFRLGLAACLAAGPAGCGRDGRAVDRPPPVVEFVLATEARVPRSTEWVGTTDGATNAKIRAQVSGYLVRQAYREGEFVRKGQLLFEIDPRTFQAALAQAQAALDRERASQHQAESTREQAQAEIARNEAQLANAEANLQRVRPLAEQAALSRKDLDDAVAAERTARASVEAARALARAAQAAVLAAREAVAGASASVDAARVELGFTRIAAPIDGVAGLAKAELGDLVGPSQTDELTTVSSLDPIKVYYTLTEGGAGRGASSPPLAAAIARARTDAHRLLLADGSAYAYAGRFYAADRQVDERTGTLRVALLFPNPGRRLRPGQFVRVRTDGPPRAVVFVPQRSVSELQGTYQVAVIGPDDRIELRSVRLGDRAGSLWAVEAGLRPGERVVAEGLQKARPGVRVAPRPFRAPGAPGERGPETAGPRGG